ncbi:hypothetical protein Mapa_001881 [Marchantia paleacea]|nr:hypothetical protein Mapa_001881 [Marchantia paleacea]
MQRTSSFISLILLDCSLKTQEGPSDKERNFVINARLYQSRMPFSLIRSPSIESGLSDRCSEIINSEVGIISSCQLRRS